MNYQIVLKKSAQKHIDAHNRSGNTALCRKIENLFLELAKHPREGTGKPEMLKGNHAGYWSRRIDREHRLVDKIEETFQSLSLFPERGGYYLSNMGTAPLPTLLPYSNNKGIRLCVWGNLVLLRE